MSKCLVCKKTSEIEKLGSKDCKNIKCKCCGTLYISNSLFERLNVNGKKHPKLSAILREASENGDKQELQIYNYMDLDKKGDSYKINERFNKFLKMLSNKTSKLGQKIKIDLNNDWPLAFCDDNEEFKELLIELKKQELINYSGEDQFGRFVPDTPYLGFRMAENPAGRREPGKR